MNLKEETLKLAGFGIGLKIWEDAEEAIGSIVTHGMCALGSFTAGCRGHFSAEDIQAVRTVHAEFITGLVSLRRLMRCVISEYRLQEKGEAIDEKYITSADDCVKSEVQRLLNEVLRETGLQTVSRETEDVQRPPVHG